MITTREELINSLHEAAELEHGLLIQYLFAAFSLKRRLDEGINALEQGFIGDVERVILRVAVEEMAHLGTVCNLLSAIGAGPHFRRPNFPQPMSSYYPFDFQLERLNQETLYRFLCFELPVDVPHPPKLHALDAAPDPLVYNRVGELYGQIQKGFETIPDLFVGTPSDQDTDDWTTGLRLQLVRDRRSAVDAIQAIIIEGEGTSTSRENSHYGRFLAIRNQLVSQTGFDPSRPVVRNPLTRLHRDTKDETQVYLITNSLAKLAAETFSHTYQTMLLMLAQYDSHGGESVGQRSALQASCRQLMSTALRPMAEQITQLPAGDNLADGNAGPTFELFSEIVPAPVLTTRWIMLNERLNAAATDCDELADAGGVLTRFKTIGESIRLLAQNLESAKRA